jgi:hypothetical protein
MLPSSRLLHDAMVTGHPSNEKGLQYNAANLPQTIRFDEMLASRFRTLHQTGDQGRRPRLEEGTASCFAVTAVAVGSSSGTAISHHHRVAHHGWNYGWYTDLLYRMQKKGKSVVVVGDTR